MKAVHYLTSNKELKRIKGNYTKKNLINLIKIFILILKK